MTEQSHKPRHSLNSQGSQAASHLKGGGSQYAMKHDKEQIIENVKQDLTEKLGEEVSA